MVNERAKQFLPFDSLKGFKAEIRKREKIIVSKKRLSEETARELSYKINQIKKGMMIKIIYYHDGEYIEIEGLVSKIDRDSKTLIVVKEKIGFKEIYSITGTEIKDFDEFGD